MEANRLNQCCTQLPSSNAEWGNFRGSIGFITAERELIHLSLGKPPNCLSNTK